MSQTSNADAIPLFAKTAALVLRSCHIRFPGRTRVARMMVGGSLRARNVALRALGGFEIVVPNIREPIGFHLFIDGEYESDTLRFLLSTLNRGSTFVDVGANIGCFVLPAARRVEGTGRVLAVEASPTILPYLRHNVIVNRLLNVTVKHCAVSDRNRTAVKFYEAPVDSFGMGSLAPQFDAAPISLIGRTLDDVLAEERIDTVDVLKVDVEGFEAGVFRGALRLLAGSKPPLVVFEFCDWAEERAKEPPGEAQRVLASCGYVLWRMEDFPVGKPLECPLTSGYGMLIGVRNQ